MRKTTAALVLGLIAAGAAAPLIVFFVRDDKKLDLVQGTGSVAAGERAAGPGLRPNADPAGAGAGSLDHRDGHSGKAETPGDGEWRTGMRENGESGTGDTSGRAGFAKLRLILLDGRNLGLFGTADELGRVDVRQPNLTGGLVRVCASLPGHARSRFATIRLSNQPESVTLMLRQGAQVNGRVGAPAGIALADAKVAARPWGHPLCLTPVYRSSIDKAGAFTIRDMPPGAYELRLEWKEDGGWKSSPETSVTIAEGETRSVNINLISGGNIAVGSGGSQDGGNPPGIGAEDSRVSIWPAEEEAALHPPECLCEGDDLPEPDSGSGLQPGKYTAGRVFRMDRSWLWIVRENVRVAAGETIDVSVEFPSGDCGGIEGKVQAAEGGGALHLCGVFLWKDGVRALARPDRSGRFGFSALPEGEYSARLIWGCWWEPVREIGKVVVRKGEVVGIGLVRGMD